jgi:hypothetical protein
MYLPFYEIWASFEVYHQIWASFEVYHQYISSKPGQALRVPAG